MKTIQSLSSLLLGAVLMATPLLAEEPAKEPAKEMKCKKADEGKKPEMKAMEAKMKAEAAALENLLDVMNSSTGDKKMEAMAAALNLMAQKEKTMKAKCELMMKDGMKEGMMKKEDGKPVGKPEVKPSDSGYYTCVMHPAVRWPVQAKCPICSMDLVPVSKKDAGGKVEGKAGEESGKAEDPHAGHH